MKTSIYAYVGAALASLAAAIFPSAAQLKPQRAYVRRPAYRALDADRGPVARSR